MHLSATTSGEDPGGGAPPSMSQENSTTVDTGAEATVPGVQALQRQLQDFWNSVPRTSNANRDPSSEEEEDELICEVCRSPDGCEERVADAKRKGEKPAAADPQ